MDARSKRLAAAKQKLQVYKLQHQLQHQQHEHEHQNQQHQVADEQPSYISNQSNPDPHPQTMTVESDDASVNANAIMYQNSQEVYPVPVFNQFQEPPVNSEVSLLVNGSNGPSELESQPTPTSNGFEQPTEEKLSFQPWIVQTGYKELPSDLLTTTQAEHEHQQQDLDKPQENTDENVKSLHQEDPAPAPVLPPTSDYYQNQQYVPPHSEEPERAHYLENNPNRYFAGQYDYEEFNGQRDHSRASHESHSDQIHPFHFTQSMTVDPDPAFELELTQLRQDNSHLQRRESELISQLQNAEKVIEDLSRERERLAVELRSELDPLRGRVGELFNENESLRAKLREMEKLGQEEKQKLEAKFSEMEAAFIHVSTGKMDLAERLDAQTELVKTMGDDLKQKDKRIEELENENKELVHSANELNIALDSYAAGNISLDYHGHQHATTEQSRSGEDHHHVHGEGCEHGHGHAHEHHTVEKSAEESIDSHSHSHSHQDHDHDHSHSHSHNHNEHSHDDHSGHSHSHSGSQAGDDHDHSHGSSPTPSAMEKKLLRLQWENSTYQEELDKLSSLLKTKTADATAVATFKEENESLKAELGRLEHLVIQLQGENDTIGDYITLYQSQRLALKEKALQKEKEMDSLAKEREHLRLQTEELGRLLKSCSHAEGGPTDLPVQKIKELLNHGGLNYHPCCGVCSGRMMDV